MTNYSDLLNEGRVKQGNFSRKQIEDCLKIAQRDLQTADTIMETSAEWAFNIAYNSMVQAGRAFMFSEGYRSAGLGHHATVIRFLEISLGKKYEDILNLMERMRRKRNNATYDSVGTISIKEANEASINAKQLVSTISTLIDKKLITV